MQTPSTRILILGGGFGGVATAQALRRRLQRDPGVEITLVNRDNYFVFAPLLASAAAGSIEALHAVAPIRQLVPGVSFRAEEIVEINLAARHVITLSPTTGQERRLPFDHLVIALGNVIDLSRLPGVAQHGKTIKTLGDALAIRNHALAMLEAAEIEVDPAARREMLTFVVAGGGFSGVEMVGELNDLVRRVIRHYPSITDDQVQVILLHGNERLLPEMSAPLADYGLLALRARGVEVRLNARLSGATPREVLLEDGRKISARTLIVAIGNAPPPVLQALDVEKQRGRIVVDELMRVAGHDGVWALGDNAVVPSRGSDAPSPPTAQYALRQGTRLGGNIAATLHGRPPRPFSYGGLGLLCLVGHGAGIGELVFGMRVRGALGWFLWRSVYWAKLPSFGRRFQVGFDWLLDLFVSRDTAQLSLARTQSVTRAHYEAGEYVFHQGDTGTHFYLIQSGEVEVIREHSSGDKVMLARLGRGEYFGETALLTNRWRNASVRCTTPVDVVALGRDDFATLAGTWAQLGDDLRELSDERINAAPLTSFIHFGSRAGGGSTPEDPFGVPSEQGARLIRASTGEEIVLDREMISLGRGPDNQIVIADPMASRRHALIQRESGQRDGGPYLIEDLGGQNGTWINGHRLTGPVTLQHGDVIAIGETELTFFQPGAISVSGLIRDLHAVNPAPERPPPGPLTGLIQGLDAPGARPPEPVPALDAPGAAPPQPVSRLDAPGIVPPELVVSLDAPGAAPPEPVSGVTGLVQDLRVPFRRAQPSVGPVTAFVQGLDAEDDTPTTLPDQEPAPPAVNVAQDLAPAGPPPSPPAGPLTDAIRALSEDDQPAAGPTPAPPQGSLTGVIRSLGEDDRPAASPAPEPPPGPLSDAIRALDQDDRPSANPLPEPPPGPRTDEIRALGQAGPPPVAAPLEPQAGPLTGVLRELGQESPPAEGPDDPSRGQPGIAPVGPPPVSSRPREVSPVAAEISPPLHVSQEPNTDPALEPSGPTPEQLTVGAVRPGPSEPHLSLLALGGPDNGATFEVGPDGATIGRALDNSITILDEQLSRRHARVEFRDGVYLLIDAGSFNGTMANGNPVTGPHSLADGDVIQLGATSLRVTISG